MLAILLRMTISLAHELVPDAATILLSRRPLCRRWEPWLQGGRAESDARIIIKLAPLSAQPTTELGSSLSCKPIEALVQKEAS